MDTSLNDELNQWANEGGAVPACGLCNDDLPAARTVVMRRRRFHIDCAGFIQELRFCMRLARIYGSFVGTGQGELVQHPPVIGQWKGTSP